MPEVDESLDDLDCANAFSLKNDREALGITY
jgi:hypothetical protein